MKRLLRKLFPEVNISLLNLLCNNKITTDLSLLQQDIKRCE